MLMDIGAGVPARKCTYMMYPNRSTLQLQHLLITLLVTGYTVLRNTSPRWKKSRQMSPRNRELKIRDNPFHNQKKIQHNKVFLDVKHMKKKVEEVNIRQICIGCWQNILSWHHTTRYFCTNKAYNQTGHMASRFKDKPAISTSVWHHGLIPKLALRSKFPNQGHPIVILWSLIIRF